MAMEKCDKGLHYYDKSVYKDGCPYCKEVSKSQKTVKVGENTPEDPKTVNLRYASRAGVPAGKEEKAQQQKLKTDMDGKTVSLEHKDEGIDPVVGWLVCLKGPERGKDYKIHSEKNRIGRGEDMDISIKADLTISRVDQAFIVYNPRRRVFRLHAGTGQRLVYLNDDEVITPEVIKDRDLITIGESEFVFVSLCGENFDWDVKDTNKNDLAASEVIEQLAKALKDQSEKED